MTDTPTTAQLVAVAVAEVVALTTSIAADIGALADLIEAEA